jgi:hypothetical protein
VKIRFQADANLNEDIVSGVLRRLPEIDFQTGNEAHLESLSDLEVLTQSAHEHRILVSHDRRTMPTHFGEFVRTQTSPGVMIVSQNADVREVIEELILIWVASEAEEYINSIRTLPL